MNPQVTTEPYFERHRLRAVRGAARSLLRDQIDVSPAGVAGRQWQHLLNTKTSCMPRD